MSKLIRCGRRYSKTLKPISGECVFVGWGKLALTDGNKNSWLIRACTDFETRTNKNKIRMENLKISNSEIVFRIDVDFENCEVDMVYKEMAARGVQTPVPAVLTNGSKIPIDKTYLPYTPSEASVDFCLHWLAGFVDEQEMCTTQYKRRKSELEEIGLETKNWYGLMMGCCHINCACAMEDFSMELVEKANKIVQDVFKKYCVYYQTKIEQLELFESA